MMELKHPLPSLCLTATRDGLTPQQQAWWVGFLKLARPVVLRHGACKGGDEQMAKIAREVLGGRVHIMAHPGYSAKDPANLSFRSVEAIELSDEVEKPEPFLPRNRTMVALARATAGCPPCAVNPGRGGTWYTIEHSREQGHPTYVCLPDGTEVGP